MTFDRRRSYQEITFEEPRPWFLSRFNIINEAYVGETWKWLLDKPLEIGTASGWKYYVGTQIGSEGTTLICPRCKVAIKYYFSSEKDVQEMVSDVLSDQICPFCGSTMSDYSVFPQEVATMSRFVLEYKKDHDALQPKID